MENQFSRTALLFGAENVEKLFSSRVIVFGLGGVGSYAVEALARSGVGFLDIVDDDVVSETNLNRQLYALHSTLGKYKVDVAEERIRDINPNCKVTKHRTFFLPENSSQFDFSKYDYIVDCIDTVAGKIQIALKAQKSGTRVISSMGAGNKLEPTKFQVADIFETSVCPLARVMRAELKKRGVKNLKCVFSTEKTSVVKSHEAFGEKHPGSASKSVPGSNAFVPSVAGLIIAGEVIKDLSGVCKS